MRWLLTYYTTVCGVGVIVPLDKNLPSDELKNLIRRSGAKALVFSQGSEKSIAGVYEEKYDVEHFICMKKAKERGLLISFDCNFRSKLWNWEPGTKKEELAGRVIREMMPYVDILFAARIDAETLLDVHPGCPESYSRIDEQPYVAEAINRRYPSVKMLLTTMRQSISATYNKWGAALYDLSNGLQYVSPCIDGKYVPYDITAIVDRIGAGDSFAAGILYALDDSELGQDLQSVVDFATASSCLCHTIMQDINYVSREDVITLMKSGGHSTVSR